MRFVGSDLVQLLRSGSVECPHVKGVFPGFPYIFYHKSSRVDGPAMETSVNITGSFTRPGNGG